MLNITQLVVLSLATWRITNLLVHEDGPGDIFVKLRSFIGVRFDEHSNRYGTNMVAQAFTCVWCLSIWIAAIMTLSINHVYLHIYVLHLLAISAGSILIEELLNGKS